MKEITYNPKQYRIEISFPFSFGMKNKVKEIPDAKFDWDERVWYLPPTKLHAKFATDFGKVNEFFIDKYVLELSRINQTSNKKTRSKLFPYQKDGLDFLHASGGRALLCDSPGVGKTHQAIAYMEESAQSKVLVVCPASVCYMWQDRIEELLKGWSTVVVEGYTKKFDTKARVVICSYNVFTNRVYELKELGFTLVVYDEIHALSNMKSRRSKASRILMTENIIGLSGTPFLNRPVELYPLLNLIQPHVWNNYWKYVHTFCDAKKDYFGHWDVKGASNLPELKKRVEHIMIRRTKDDVLKDLPDLTKNYLPYLPQEKSLVKTYQEAYEVAKSMPSNVSPRVRILEMRKVIGLMKVKPAIELAEDILVDSGKVVLFAIHKDVVAQLEEGLKKYNVVKIVGDTPQKDRNDIVNRFQSDPEVKVAIISEAGGEGINLYAASNLIFVEREWNPGKETQIMGRVHRIGQTKPVSIYYIIAKNTIDERIHRLIEKKAEVLGQVYSFEDIPVNDLFDVGVN